MTRQRRTILEELRKVNSHPPADEVYKLVRRRLPRISLGTVYRNLETLSGRGLIRKLELGGSQRRFDGHIKNHYHVRCVRCGDVEDVPVEPVAELEGLLHGVSDYKVIGHRLEFVGLCPQCKKGEANSHKKVQTNIRKEKENGTEGIED
jgi:Fur family ferric uptake transcriptional regulator